MTDSIEQGVKTEAHEEPEFHSLPASDFTLEELVDIYNRTRVDYIVPMPMNVRRMQQYVFHYDIDLDASVVALDSDEDVVGIGMLGLRDDRAWITRLGVIPDKRRRGKGQFMMDAMLDSARDHNMRLAQLEVITGNTPAHKLFLKCGFEETRELLIIRRPPGEPSIELFTEGTTSRTLSGDEIMSCLENREPGASWVEETTSIIKAGQLEGIGVTLPSGHEGWAVFCNSPFQITHLVIDTPPEVKLEMTQALLYQVHAMFGNRDTKLENLPADDPRWAVFQKMGYVETFRRTEMFLYFD